MEIMNFITEKALILIPVLYILGEFIKRTEAIKDKFIPLILMAVSIVFSLGLLGITFESAIQGILVAGATVLTNQVVKQYNK